MRALTPRPAHGASGTEKDSRWAAVVARDRRGGWDVLLLGEDDRGVLPAVVRRATGEAGRTCAFMRRPRTRSGRAFGHAALPPEEPRSESGRRRVAGGLPGDRGRGVEAEPGIVGERPG